ncbi:MAG: phosphoribosylanthranilate isomerase [Anaerolineae bacterium]
MVKVKICGLTTLRDALAAAEAGADFLGFVFYPPSPRYITPEQARQIIEAVRSQHAAVRFVGVFVDEELDEVRKVMARCDLDYAQLHGSEPPEYVAALMPRAIKAFRVRDRASLQELSLYKPAAFLLDAYCPTRPGGTGTAFDWGLATLAKTCGRIILAGGLTPENVAEAVRHVRPYAVDVSTGVEARPGEKDKAKMRHFISAAKVSISALLKNGD